MAPHYVNPALNRLLKISSEVVEVLRSIQDDLGCVNAGVINEDGDIAIRVDKHGTLADVWLKPGVADTKSPRTLAFELNRLLAQAVDDVSRTSSEMLSNGLAAVSAQVAAAPNYSEILPSAGSAT